MNNPNPLSLLRKVSVPHTSQKALDLLSTRLIDSAVIFLLGVCVYRTIDAWLYAPISVDTGTFLSIAERMKDGWVPGHDLRVGYTPLGIFLLSLVGKIAPSGISSYQSYLAFILTLQWACVILVYFIGTTATPSKIIRLIAAVTMLLIIQLYEGPFIFLEIFVVFFALIALLIIVPPTPSIIRWCAAGFFVGLAFLSKQYGVAVLAALGIMVLCDNSSSWRQKLMNITSLGAGFLLVIVALFTVFWLVFNFPPSQIAHELWGWINKSGYYSRGTRDFSNINRFIFNTFPFLVFTPFLFALPSIRSSRVYRLGFIIMVCLGASLLVRTFLHYFHLIIPFVGLLALVILERSRQAGSLIFLIVAAAYIYPVTSEHLKTPYFSEHKEIRDEQLTISRDINAILPARSKVLLFANPDIMYTANFLPVDNFSPGYGFLSNFNEEQLLLMIDKARFLVVDRTNKYYFMPEQKRIENKVGDFFYYIQRQGFILKAEIHGHIQIWARKTSEEGANKTLIP